MSINRAHHLVGLLKDCAQRKDLHTGTRLHSSILKWGLVSKNSFIGNSLVHMYLKCGSFAKAHYIFQEFLIRDVVLWTSLIAAYARHGWGKEALVYFDRMLCEGVLPNSLTFACILKACGCVGASTNKGRELHASIVGKGLLSEDVVLGNALLDMYGKCGAPIQAQRIFDELPARDVVSWNAIIAGHCQQGNGEEALDCFDRLEDEGISPDMVTFLCVVKACGSIGAVEKGLDLHSEVARRGFLEEGIVFSNALVDMYAKCGALKRAKQVFEELPARDVVSWTALITGYCQFGYDKEALDCFKQLQYEGLSPNPVTLLCILKACSSLKEVEIGLEIHEEIMRKGLLGKDNVLGSALVDLYAKCGALGKAQEVLNELPVRDVVSWTSLIAEYCQHEHAEKALQCYEHMRCEGLSPDAVTFACILKACGSIGATEKGKEVHEEIVREGLVGKVTMLASAVVDMYAKCNALARAQEVFDKLPHRDVASWTALISGYAQVGQYGIVIDSFAKMLREGTEPNLVTFIVVLGACSALGLVHEGETYFEVMRASYGIIPTSEHLTCMVDLFSREGHLDKAMAVLTNFPTSDCLAAWFALLSACKKLENPKAARLAFENALQLDEESAVAYVCMSHVYMAAGMQGDATDLNVSKLHAF